MDHIFSTDKRRQPKNEYEQENTESSLKSVLFGKYFYESINRGEEKELHIEKLGAKFGIKYTTSFTQDEINTFDAMHAKDLPPRVLQVVQFFKKEGESVSETLSKVAHLKALSFRIDERTFDLGKQLSPEVSIMFRTDGDDITRSSADTYMAQAIFLGAPLGNLFDILVLLHEAGHFKYKQSLASSEEKKFTLDSRVKFHKLAKDKKDLSDHMTQKEAESVLLDEREAWEFALRNLQPILEKLNIDKKIVNAMMYGESFGSYVNKLTELMNSHRNN